MLQYDTVELHYFGCSKTVVIHKQYPSKIPTNTKQICQEISHKFHKIKNAFIQALSGFMLVLYHTKYHKKLTTFDSESSQSCFFQ